MPIWDLDYYYWFLLLSFFHTNIKTLDKSTLGRYWPLTESSSSAATILNSSAHKHFPLVVKKLSLFEICSHLRRHSVVKNTFLNSLVSFMNAVVVVEIRVLACDVWKPAWIRLTNDWKSVMVKIQATILVKRYVMKATNPVLWFSRNPFEGSEKKFKNLKKFNQLVLTYHKLHIYIIKMNKTNTEELN